MYRSLNLLSFQVIQIMLLGLMNGYFSFVNVVLWEMGPFTGNMNLLVTAVVMEPLAIMKCVYIRENHKVSMTTLKRPWTESITFLSGEE